MPKVAIYDIQGQVVSEMELNPEIFDIETSEAAVHKVVVAHLAAKRQGTASTKSRGEVSGGGARPWRQKGTGRARHGTIRSPLWVGGGVAFGPKPREYRLKVPKKVRRLAMKSALTTKVQNDNFKVLKALEINSPKTKEVVELINNLEVNKKTLVVTSGADSNVYKSARNIPKVSTAFVDTLNVYDILNHDAVIITEEAVKKVEEVFA
ncbi:50S ribosomal protein L4 [Proteinivorax hydrogeniformans]|uniref:Large ribosomal subunit protein uL4 n=1 Tax=Proteinivorax hydrogeniformans TaxID=1826727 RepID=A0AAU8HU18_9FIRM